MLVLHCATDCPWRRRYARNCPRPLRIDSIGVRVRPRGQFAVVCHLAIVSAASLRFRRQHPRLVNLVETERTRHHWRHSEALKSAGQSPIGLLPLDGFSSAVPSFQLRPVVGVASSRVPPSNASSHFVGFGDKSRDNSKYFFQTQDVEFLFLSHGTRRAAFGGSIASKTPVLKLKRPLVCKPPAAIASELTRVACAPLAKPQVAGLRHS